MNDTCPQHQLNAPLPFPCTTNLTFSPPSTTPHRPSPPSLFTHLLPHHPYHLSLTCPLTCSLTSAPHLLPHHPHHPLTCSLTTSSLAPSPAPSPPSPPPHLPLHEASRLQVPRWSHMVQCLEASKVDTLGRRR